MAETNDAPAGAPMQVDAGLVRQLADMLDATRLTEIEVQDGDRRIRVARTVSMAAVQAAPALAPVAAMPPPAAAPSAAPAAPVLAAPGDHPGTVKSPMVGTVYLSSEPGAAPFVSVGAPVAAGATLLIVEAMKVMNPILAPRAGKVTALLVENGQPVEFEQPLVVVE